MTIPEPEAGSFPLHQPGSASALVGAAQFLVGAAAAPLVGVAGSTSAVPMAITKALLGRAGLATFVVLSGRSPVLAGR